MFKYITFNTGAETICFLVAVICLTRNVSRTWKILVPYLFITCAVEYAGVYLKKNHQPNQWPYNILLIFQILVVSLIFMNLFSRYLKKKTLVIVGVAVLLLFYIYDTISHGFFTFYELTYNVMSVLYIIYCLYYFYLLLNAESYIELEYSANFWWVSGALFFYFGSTVVNIFRDELSPINMGGHNIGYYIYIILNIILYGCWSYSFICKQWLTTTPTTSRSS